MTPPNAEPGGTMEAICERSVGAVVKRAVGSLSMVQISPESVVGCFSAIIWKSFSERHGRLNETPS